MGSQLTRKTIETALKNNKSMHVYENRVKMVQNTINSINIRQTN